LRKQIEKIVENSSQLEKVKKKLAEFIETLKMPLFNSFSEPLYAWATLKQNFVEQTQEVASLNE